MRVLDASGDSVTTWDPTDKKETAAAQERFETLTKDRKFSAFRVKGGEPGERLDKFDKEAEEIVLVPQLQGG